MGSLARTRKQRRVVKSGKRKVGSIRVGSYSESDYGQLALLWKQSGLDKSPGDDPWDWLSS